MAGSIDWKQGGKIDIISDGSAISKPELLFEKIEDSVVDYQIAKLMKSKSENEANEIDILPQKEVISYDDFVNMDIRIGEVIAAEAVPKSNKLLKLKIDTGIDQRTVVSGIAKHYQPKDIIGSKVTILANLAPRKIMGIESQGMILMGENIDGKLSLIQPDSEISNGSQVN